MALLCAGSPRNHRAMRWERRSGLNIKNFLGERSSSAEEVPRLSEYQQLFTKPLLFQVLGHYKEQHRKVTTLEDDTRDQPRQGLGDSKNIAEGVFSI